MCSTKAGVPLRPSGLASWVAQALSGLALAAALLSTSCGQSPIAIADLEVAAVDLGACVRREPACVIEGGVRQVSPFGPGDLAIELAEGASVQLPLTLPASFLLAYLDLGIHYPKSQDNKLPAPPHALSLSIEPGPLWQTALEPTAGYNRMEIPLYGADGQAIPVPAGSRLTIRSTLGTLTVLYVVARLNAPKAP